MIKEIVDGIFVQSGRYVQELRCLIRGKSWCTLIDAPQYFDEAQELDQLAKDLSPGGVRLAILTHGHLDHTATLQLFSNALVVGTEAARKYMLGRGQQELDKQKKDDAQLQQVTLVPPCLTVSCEMSLHTDTGRELRLIPSPGHSEDSMMVMLQPGEVLFSGDSLSPVVPPYFPDAPGTLLEQTLVRINTLRPKILVPGHGYELVGPDVVRETSAAIRYLEALRIKVLDGLDQGHGPSDLSEKIGWGDCSDKPEPPEDYIKFHKENVENMADELSAHPAGCAYE